MGVRNCAEIGENLQKILKYLIADEQLGKLLYYTDKDPLNPSHPAPSKQDLYGQLICIIPYVAQQEQGKSMVVLRITNAETIPNNREFKEVNMAIDVYVPYTEWFIKDTNLRPFAILGRIQTLLSGLKINGLGTLEGGDFELTFLSEEICCYTAYYQLISYD